MPEMISLRTFRLATTTGHNILFTANEPRFIPDEAITDAMAAGCVPANEADRPFIDDQQRARAEFTGPLRQSIIYLAIDALVRENNAKNFDGAGLPKLDVLSDRTGFDVRKEERRSVFQLYMAAKKGNGEFAVHKDAGKALEVVAAESKADLVALAKKHGVDDEQAAALTSRDLRKLLLAKLSALTV